jgi:hypothetical protein
MLIYIHHMNADTNAHANAYRIADLNGHREAYKNAYVIACMNAYVIACMNAYVIACMNAYIKALYMHAYMNAHQKHTETHIGMRGQGLARGFHTQTYGDGFLSLKRGLVTHQRAGLM